MGSEGDKKASGGWRVKVKNVIKVVSHNKKPSKMKPEASTIKSPKFHISNWTSSESDKEKLETGELMMLDVAETKFGIKPLRRKFRDQKLLIYTLPNENKSHHQVPVENLVKISEEKLKLESEKLKGIPKDITTPPESKTIGNGNPDSDNTTIKLEASEKGDKLTNQEKFISKSEGMNVPVMNSMDCRPEPGKVEGSQSMSLFSSPLPKGEAPTEGMYFGPQPLGLHLDVN